jgi:hypothetical protein
LLNRSLRMAAYSLTKNPSAWKQIRPNFQIARDDSTFEDVLAESKSRHLPERVWEKIQSNRWAITTNHRSLCC